MGKWTRAEHTERWTSDLPWPSRLKGLLLASLPKSPGLRLLRSAWNHDARSVLGIDRCTITEKPRSGRAKISIPETVYQTNRPQAKRALQRLNKIVKNRQVITAFRCANACRRTKEHPSRHGPE